MSITKEKIGDLCWWFEDGLLTIEGEGEMPSFSCKSPETRPPWWRHRDKIIAVDIRDGVTTIGVSAFLFILRVGSIALTLPPSLKSIARAAFVGCTGLTSVEFPPSLFVIGAYAFESCTRLTSVVIPDSVGIIIQSAFNHCIGLKSVKLPCYMLKIDSWTFSRCTSLETIEFSDHIHTIGQGAFSSCTSLRSLEIPSTVTRICGGAFFKCSSLESVVIPALIDDESSILDKPSTTRGSSIDSEEWMSLDKISVHPLYIPYLTPAKLKPHETAIGDEAFAECRRLREITVLSPTPPSMIARSFRAIDKEAVLYVPHGCTDAYRTTKPWKDKFKNIKELD